MPLHKHSTDACSQTVLRFHTPSASQPDKSGNEHACLCVKVQPTGEGRRGEWVWPRGSGGSARSPSIHHVTLGSWNEQPHGWAWANPKQYTALQDSRDTLLEMVNPSDGDLRWNERKNKGDREEEMGLRHRGSRTGASGTRQKYMLPLWHQKSPFQSKIHHVFLTHTSFRGGKGEKSWTEERQALVGKWTDTAYFILAISSILLG